MALSRSLAAVPRLALLLIECQAPLVRSLTGELDDLPDLRAVDRPGDRRRAAGAGARRRIRARRLRPGSRRAAAHQPIRQAGDRRDGRRPSARSTGIKIAEGRLQPRLRLLHRSLEVEPARGAGALHPQADDGRRRALHHAGAEGIRGEGARRRRAHRRARARGVRDAAAARRRRIAARARHRARRGRHRRAERPGRNGDGLQLHQAARARRRRDFRHRRAPSRGRAAGRRHVRAERHPAQCAPRTSW